MRGKEATLKGEFRNLNPYLTLHWASPVESNKHGSLTLGDCLEAERFIMTHGCADLEEIREYNNRKWKEFCKNNNLKWDIWEAKKEKKNEKKHYIQYGLHQRHGRENGRKFS